MCSTAGTQMDISISRITDTQERMRHYSNQFFLYNQALTWLKRMAIVLIASFIGVLLMACSLNEGNMVGGLDATQHRSTGTVIAVSDKNNRVTVQLDDNDIPWVDILPDNAPIPDLSEPVTFDFSNGYAIADLGWVTPGSSVVVTYWWSASRDGTLSAWNIEPLTSSAPDAAALTSRAP